MEVQSGGNRNLGHVVRHGEVVHRPPSPQSDAIAALLEHLERAGFDGAPRYLRRTADSLQVLTWVGGDTYTRDLPAWLSEATTIRAVAQLVRRFHDAAARFVLPPSFVPLLEPPPQLAGNQLCHGDVGFSNVVFRDRDPIALIDFEFIVHADPLLDVAAVASQWTRVPRAPEEDGETRRDAVLAGARAAAGGYALDAASRARLPDAMVTVEETAIEYVAQRAEEGDAAAAAAIADQVLVRRRYRRDWFERHAAALADAALSEA